MLQLDELTKDSAGDSEATFTKVEFSLKGDRLFIITHPKGEVMVWDISSVMFKPGKILPRGVVHNHNLIAVREGLLLQTNKDTLELWDFELRECIRSWNGLWYLCRVSSISEDQVACIQAMEPYPSDIFAPKVEKQVIIVDTTRKGFVSTILFMGFLLLVTVNVT